MEKLPLGEVPAEIQRQTGTAVRIDRAALRRDARSSELGMKISTNLRDITVRDLLERLCRACELEIAVDGERNLVLTTQSGLRSDRNLNRIDGMLLLSYDVSELLTGYRMQDRLENPEKILQKLIQSSVYPAMWESVGGPWRMKFVDDSLIIDQSLEAHDALADLISSLLRCRRLAQTWDGKTPPPAQVPIYTLSPEENAIAAALNKQISLKFAGGTLRNLAAQIAREQKVEVQIDDRALEDVGLSAATKVEPFELTGASLASTLRKILREYDLTYVAREGVLLLTTPEDCECEVVTELFPIFDLCRHPDERFNVSPDELMALLKNLVRPTTWDEVGGPGSIGYVPQCGCLVVSQERSVLSEMAVLLSRYRQLVYSYADNPMVFSTEPVSLDVNERTAAIADRLKRSKVTCDFADVTLAEAVQRLGRQTELPFVIRHRDLEDVGVSADEKISVSAINRPLRDVLQKLLRGYDLTFCVEDEAIVITCADSGCGWATTMYPIFDLTQEPPLAARGSPAEIAASLVNRIHDAVDAESWEDAGGPGAAYGFFNGAAIIVSQTPGNQMHVEELLKEMRRSPVGSHPRRRAPP